MAHTQIFLSTVSAEFRSYRDRLRHDLTRPNVSVAVQEDFIVTGTETLDMLDDYIRQCDAVIHLIGDMTGALAKAPSLAVLLERYSDLGEKLPPLAPFLQSGALALSYTQWEAWLALYHRKPLIIATPEETAQRDERYEWIPEQCAAQQAHLQRLAEMERYPFRFANADRLAVEVLRSKLQEILRIKEARNRTKRGVSPGVGDRFDEYCTILAEQLNRVPYTELVRSRNRTSVPPLSSIYVKPTIKRPMQGFYLHKGDCDDDTAITIDQAVARGKHILLQGEPGSGKTSMVKSLAVTLAESWRNGQQKELIPVYLSAREFAPTTASDGSFGRAVETQIVSFLGKRLVRGLPPNFFVDPLPGKCGWLLIIDGMDEVVNPEERRALLDSINNQVRLVHQRIIFLVTSRPLSELDTSLTGEHFYRYDAIPFQEWQVKDLVLRWFHCFNRSNEDAENFLGLLQKSRLRELFRSPVFITMTILTFLWHGERILPETRIDLYEQFLEALLDEAGSPEKRNSVCDEWRNQFGDKGADLCRKIIGNVKPLLVEIAMFQQDYGVEATATLGEAYRIARIKGWLDLGWHLGNRDIRWIREFGLKQVLVGTGLIVEFGDGLMFSHNTVREYLVALHVTERETLDGNIGTKILGKWMDPRWTQIAIICLLNWGKRNEFRSYLQQILFNVTSLSLRGAKFAAELIADGFSVNPELELKVVDRLLGWNPCADLFATFSSPNPIETLALLSDRVMVRGKLIEYFRSPSCNKALLEILKLVLRKLDVAELKKIADSSQTGWVRVDVALSMSDHGCAEEAMKILRAIALDNTCTREARQRSIQGLYDMKDRDFLKSILRKKGLPEFLRGYAYLLAYQVDRNPTCLDRAIDTWRSNSDLRGEGSYTILLLEVLAASGKVDTIIAMVSEGNYGLVSELEHILKIDLPEIRSRLVAFLVTLLRDVSIRGETRKKALLLLLEYGRKDQFMNDVQNLFDDSELKEYEKVDLAIKLAYVGYKDTLEMIAQAEAFETHSKLRAIVVLSKLEISDKWAQQLKSLAASQQSSSTIKLLIVDALIEVGLSNDATSLIEEIVNRDEPSTGLVRLLHSLYRADLLEALIAGGKAGVEVVEMCMSALVNLGAYTTLFSLVSKGRIQRDFLVEYLPKDVVVKF